MEILKSIGLVLLLVIVVIGGLLWLDFIGVINVRDQFSPYFNSFGVESPSTFSDPNSKYLLDNERLAKERIALDLERDQLEQEKLALTTSLEELQALESEIVTRENQVLEKEESLSQLEGLYADKDQNLRQVTNYLNNMPPEAAVEQLIAMDELEAVDVLRTAEKIAEETGGTSLVAYWLSLMPADKAASIEQNMLIKP